MSNWKTFGFQNETTNYLNAVALTGGSISYDTAELVNNFVETCKASGIWDNLVDVGVFVGDNLNAALTKLKWHPAAGPYLVNVSGNFTAASYQERGPFGGLSGNGTNQCADTRVPANIVTPNQHISFCLTNPQFAGGVSKGYIGSERASAGDSMILGYLINGTTNMFRYGTGAIGSNQAGLATGPVPGFMVGNYNNSLNRDEYYLSGAQRGISQSTAPLTIPNAYPNSNLLLFNIQSAGAPTPTAYLPANCTFYSIGTSFTPLQCSGFSQIVQSFQNQLGRAAL